MLANKWQGIFGSDRNESSVGYVYLSGKEDGVTSIPPHVIVVFLTWN